MAGFRRFRRKADRICGQGLPDLQTAVINRVIAQPRFSAPSPITLGGVMAHVVVCVGGGVVESVITRKSAEEMKLQKGRQGHHRYQIHGSNVAKGL
jgi:hypothetical protein